MTNVAALKRLAAAIVDGEMTADKVPGKTTSEVIDYLAKYYAGEYVGELAVSSAAGTALGTTKITVTPTLTEGNSYVYQICPGKITPPDYMEVVDYTAWDGTSDITAEDGHYVGIYEINSDDQVLKFGQVAAVTNLG